MSTISIEALKEIEWEAEYLWDILFVGAPKPFQQFFPAVSVEENLFTVESYDMEIGGTTYSVPKSSKEFTIRVTFLDNQTGALKDWLSTWANAIIFKGGRVAPLSTCTKVLSLIKKTREDKISKQSTYTVYPRGELNYIGSSESNSPQYTVEFVIVNAQHS